MTEELVFTKKVSVSGKGYLAWVPKHISDFLKLSDTSYVEASIRIVGGKKELRFTKRIAKSGRGLLLWIPKDISEFLKIKKTSVCEFRIRYLGDMK